MPSLTRRETLAAASSSLVLLAGCAGSDRSSHSEPPAESEPVEYEFERVRTTTESVLFRTGDETDRTVSERRERYDADFVSRESNFESIEFASTEGGTQLQSFANATDFETESVFLYSTGVSECHDIKLESVTLDGNDGDPHLDFCRFVRPADVECDADTMHTVGYAVRLPIDGRDTSGYGTGMSHGCAGRPDPDVFETTVTVTGGGKE
ncbi:MAG: hypothetical protein U5K70_08965 [Halodesulfurarchaeum sp.]|nr:hypothetical protein [Halodesulfurarchaeum sp.]